MGQNKDNNSSTKPSSSTLELARELGILPSNESKTNSDDLTRLELLVDSSNKVTNKEEPNPTVVNSLTKEDIKSLTKALLDKSNQDLLQDLLESIESNLLKSKANNILKIIEQDKEEIDNTLNVKKESKSVTLNSNNNSDELLKLILDDKEPTQEKVENKSGELALDSNIESNKSSVEDKELISLDNKEELSSSEIKVDKFYVVKKDDSVSEKKSKVTSKDLDEYLSKKVTYEDKDSLQEYSNKEKSVDTTKYYYKDISAISTILKAVIYPIIALLPVVLLSWLKGNLHLSPNYLNQVEPYRSSIVRFFNNFNIDMKIVTYILLFLSLILSIYLTLKFLKRILIHFKNSKMLTDKRFNYVASKFSVVYIYVRTIILSVISVSIFALISYAIYYFTIGTINFNELNIKADLNNLIEWGRALITKYIN